MNKDKDNLPFSKRYGHEPIEYVLQIDSMDYTLRIGLWNAFYKYIYYPKENERDLYSNLAYKNLHLEIWVSFFKNAIDDFPSDSFNLYTKNFILDHNWFKIYNLFEFILHKFIDKFNPRGDFENFILGKLEENNSGYTILNKKFIPISNFEEINEVQRTQKLATEYKLSGIQKHLNTAIELLSQKPNPDYRNSIKESISMVEVISRLIIPTENTLGKALSKLDSTKKINNTLKSGFEKLYAYTNDKNGIRHALMLDESIELEDARFFLISCSAFTNYLIEKARKDNLLQEA